MPLEHVAAGLEVRVRAGQDEFAVHRFVGVLDFEGEQAPLFVEEELRIVGSGLKDRPHDFEELIRFVEFRGGQARPDAVEEFRDVVLRHHGAGGHKLFDQRRGKARLHRIEALVPAHPQRHLAVEGDLAVLFGNTEGLFVAALEEHVETQPVLVKARAQLDGQGRAHDGAGDVRILPEHVVFMPDGPEEPRDEPFRDFDAVAVIVEVVPDLAGHLQKLRRLIAPLGIAQYLLKRGFLMHGGKARLVLPCPEKGHDEAPRLGIETENEIMPPCFRLQRTGKKAAETLPPLGIEALRFFGRAVILVEVGVHLERGGGHVAADAHEGLVAIATVRNLGIRRVEQQMGRIVLKVLALHDAFDVPPLAFLADGQLVDAAAVQDFLPRVPDIFRDGIFQEALNQGAGGTFLTNVHIVACPCFCHGAAKPMSLFLCMARQNGKPLVVDRIPSGF